MVSHRGSDNAACFGADDPVARGLDEMAGNTCELARGLSLGDVRYSDADVDGKIEPGEVLQLRVELSGEHSSYPGVFARVASEHVVPDTNVDGRYAILAVSAAEVLTLDFQVSADAEPGQTLSFAVCAADFPGRRTPCRQVDELDFGLTVD